MTNMKRQSVSLPPELENAIFELRKTDRFCKCSISEIMRELLKIGIEEQRAAAAEGR